MLCVGVGWGRGVRDDVVLVADMSPTMLGYAARGSTQIFLQSMCFVLCWVMLQGGSPLADIHSFHVFRAVPTLPIPSSP